MDEIIKKLVEVDKECVAQVEAAKAKKLDAQTNMNDKKSEIYNEYLENQKEQVEKHKADLVSKNQNDANALNDNYEKTIKSMESLYEENKDTWVNQIVERCLK